MIARYDGKRGRWSAAGLTLSLIVGGVALTGAVKGQDGPAAAAADPAQVGSGAPAAAPQPGAHAPTASVAAAATSVANGPFDAGAVRRLWDEKYAGMAYGTEANRAHVRKQYVDEVFRKAGSEEAGKRLLNEADVRAGGTAPYPELAAADAALKVRAGDEDADAAILTQLERKIPELSFEAAGLSEVLDFLRDASSVNIVVDWGSLENAGLPRDAPVSLRVRDVTVAHALELILSSAARGSVPLGYAIDRNVVRVATSEMLDQYTDVRAYDVRDLVPAELPMEALKQMVQETVAPDSWRDSGGTVGSVHASKHKMLITQTATNHRQIKAVLKMLREEPHEAPRAANAASAAKGPAAPAGH